MSSERRIEAMSFEVDQLVRITKQPDILRAQVVGETGYIQDILFSGSRAYAQVCLLKINGECSGVGSVPLDCLAPCEDPVWLSALRVCLLTQQQLQAEADADNLSQQQKLKNAYQLTAASCGVSTQLVQAIVETFKLHGIK